MNGQSFIVNSQVVVRAGAEFDKPERIGDDMVGNFLGPLGSVLLGGPRTFCRHANET
jgi:hypothetical protein